MRTTALVLAALLAVPLALLVLPSASACSNVVSVRNVGGVCSFQQTAQDYTITNDGPVCVFTACPWLGHGGPFYTQTCYEVYADALTEPVDSCLL